LLTTHIRRVKKDQEAAGYRYQPTDGGGGDYGTVKPAKRAVTA